MRIPTARTVIKFSLAVIVVCVAWYGVVWAAHAAAKPPTTTVVSWFVKGQDLAPNGSPQAIAAGVNSTGMLAAGATASDFRWIGCGWLGTFQTGQSDYTPCSEWGPKAVPLFEDYWRLRTAAKTGLLHHRTVMLDLETWSFTPVQQQHLKASLPHLLWYARLAGELSRRYCFHLILTTGGGLNPYAPQALAQAARYGAYAVAVQSQGRQGRPEAFTSYVGAVVAAVREANPKTLVIAGLATNTPTVFTAGQMQRAYGLAIKAGADGAWINSDNWLNLNQCTPAEGGPGCPAIGADFLTAIGAQS